MVASKLFLREEVLKAVTAQEPLDPMSEVDNVFNDRDLSSISEEQLGQYLLEVFWTSLTKGLKRDLFMSGAGI